MNSADSFLGPDLALKVRQVQVHHIYDQAFSTAFLNPLMAGLVVLTLWDQVPFSRLGLWFGAIVLAQLLSLSLIWAYKRQRPSEADTWRWYYYQIGVSILMALVWGVAVFVLWPAGSQINQLTLTFIILATATSGGIIYAPFSVFYMPYVSLMLGAVITRFIYEGTPAHFMLAVVCLIILGVYYRMGRRQFGFDNETFPTDFINKVRDAEKILREREQQLLFITDNIPAYVAYVGVTDLRYRFVSTKFEQAYNLPRERIIGQHIKDIIGEANYQFALEHIDIVRSARETSYENVFETMQGKRWIEVNYVPTFDSGGEVEGIVVLSFDITQRRQAEEALRESQELFELFMDKLPHGIFIKDEAYRTIYVNQYMKERYNAELWLGKDAYEVFPQHKDLAEAMLADDRQALRTGQTVREERVPDKDGRERVSRTTKFRIPRGSKPPLLGAIGLDITERVKAEKELTVALDTARRLQDEAEAANRAKSAFLANMNHELRTPLNAIIGFTQIIARSKTLPPKQQENLEIINRNGEHLLALINQVLELSKIEAGRMGLNKTVFDLHQMLNELEDMFRLRADERNIRLAFERSSNLPQIICTDDVKLRQVLINLLNNALKFTQAGQVILRVESGEQVEPNRQEDCACLALIFIHFEVSDTGPGIAPEEIASLFEAFSQTETGQKAQEGTGLGLPISRKFVQLLGGKDIKVQSPAQLSSEGTSNPGASFTFDIQAEVVEPDEIAEKPYSHKHISDVEGQIVGLAPHQPTYRLLIVDDDTTNRQVLYELFAPLGFDLREAENGQQAIEVWQTFRPHLIWMDMRMPLLDGYEATKRIKSAEEAETKTVIIALTASSFEEDKAKILAVGCDDFLRKPFRVADLFQMMRWHIGVEFVYETAEDVLASSVDTEDSLTPAMMVCLSANDIARLAEALELSDIGLANQIIADIQLSQPALADRLSRLINNFEYETILATIQQTTL
jgi:PAS domain S-box-containing protein